MSDESTKKGTPVTGDARRVLFVGQALLVFVILGLGVLVFFKLASLREEPEKKKVQDHVPVVRVMTVAPQDLNITVSGEGTADFRRRVEIRTQVSGRIVYISPKLEEGNRLEKDQPLLKIDRSDYDLAFARAKAEVAIQEAALERLRLDQKSRRQIISTLRDDLTIAEAEVVRARDLWKNTAGSEAEYDTARRTYLQQKNALEVAENALNVIPARIEEEKAKQKQAEAKLAQAQLDLERTEIKAPFDGIVVSESAEVGQIAQVNQLVAVLGDDGQMEVTAVLNLSELRNLPSTNGPNPGHRDYAGTPATVTWRGPGETWQWAASVSRVEMVDARTRTIPVVVLVNAPDHAAESSRSERRLLAGMYCLVDIRGTDLKNALVIPRNALREGNRLYVEKDGKLAITTTTIVHAEGDRLVVSGGLEPGDRLVVSELLFPADGMTIDPLPAGPTSRPADDSDAGGPRT